MELETVNKLYLELSQIATAKTEKEIALESRCMNETTANILKAMAWDSRQGWGKLLPIPKSFHKDGLTSFIVRYEDGSEKKVSFKVEEI